MAADKRNRAVLDDQARQIITNAVGMAAAVVGGRVRSVLVVVQLQDGMTMLGTALDEKLNADPAKAAEAIVDLATGARGHIKNWLDGMVAESRPLEPVDLPATPAPPTSKGDNHGDN